MRRIIKLIKTAKYGLLCRSCLNKMFKLQLKRSNCYYYIYAGQCAHCGKMKPLVTKITLEGILRSIGSGKVKKEEEKQL